MNRFAYREARTVQEAVEIMRQEEGARIVAGATDVLIRWRQGIWKPRYVLNIKRIPGLDEVSYNPDTGLSLGALVTVRTLERHPLIQEADRLLCPLLPLLRPGKAKAGWRRWLCARASWSGRGPEFSPRCRTLA